MQILYCACEASLCYLIFDEGKKIWFISVKLAIFETSAWLGQLNFYPTSQEITVLGMKNAFGGCLYYIPRA